MVLSDIDYWFKIIKDDLKMAYVFVAGDLKVTAMITVEDAIKKILQWILFTTEHQRDRIYDDSIEYFSDIKMFTEKYIYDLSTDFSRRNQDSDNICLEIRRTKSMKALLLQVLIFYLISIYPTIVDLNDVMFIQHLDTALYRADIIKKLIEQSKKMPRKLLRVHW